MMKILPLFRKTVTNQLAVKKKMAPLAVFLLFTGGVVTYSPTAISASPSTGKAAYKTIYSGTVLSSMELNEKRSVELREIIGITQSESESGNYAGLSARCLVYFESTADTPLINGNCTLMDSDGDKMYQRFASGKISILGGTGKYHGISGLGTITNVRYIRAQSVRSIQFEVSHQVDWSFE